jgi:hypothetical protein
LGSGETASAINALLPKKCKKRFLRFAELLPEWFGWPAQVFTLKITKMFKIYLAIFLALACASGTHKTTAHHYPTTNSNTDTTGSGGDDGHIHP